MTRAEQRTQKLIEQLGNVGDLVADRPRGEAAEVKRAARALTSLLKKRSSPRSASKATAARRGPARGTAAKTARKTTRKTTAAPRKRSASRLTKDGRPISEVRRAAAYKAWATKRQKTKR